MWFRVFGMIDLQPQPAALLEHLTSLVANASGDFRGDDQGWFHADLQRDGKPFLQLERYLVREEGIRAELNSWAAWLETAETNPHYGWLMERIINTRQLFTLHPPDGESPSEAGRTATRLCRYLARCTDGVYQADGVGFSSADGALLVPE
jgi:hypothetical protein